MKGIFFVGTVFFFLFLGCVQYSVQVQTPVPSSSLPSILPPLSKVCFSPGNCVNVELATTSVQRAQGLMNRSQLDENAGMLFVFERMGVQTFWMKDTLISLDMIWISDQNKIIDIQSAVSCESDPCKIYTPAGNALYVLEINSGLAKKWRIEKGQSVELDIH